MKYGCGADPFQFVWINEREMSKYDENYAQINKTVAGMEDGNVIQPLPPTPLFDDLTAEDAASLQTPLADSIEVWIDAFVTGSKSLDTDWDAYVAEMKNLQHRRILQDVQRQPAQINRKKHKCPRDGAVQPIWPRPVFFHLLPLYGVQINCKEVLRNAQDSRIDGGRESREAQSVPKTSQTLLGAVCDAGTARRILYCI